MKKVNGLLLSLLCISSISGLTSCTTAEDIVSEVKASLVFPNLTSGIKKGFDVYNEIDNVEISYESANPKLLYFNEENTKCIVNVLDPGSSQQITSFTATFKYKNVTDTKTFKVRILPAGHMTTVSELVALADAGVTGSYEYSAYSMDAVLVAKTDKSTLFYDGTGYIYVYKSCTNSIGTYFNLDGSISYWNGIIEFNSDTTFETLSEEIPFEVPEFNPIEFTSDFSYNVWYTGNPSMATYCGSMVKLTGTPKTSTSSDGTKTYYNYEIDNVSKVTGSILYPTDEILEVMNKAIEEKKKTVIEGYTIYISGSSSKYLNILVTGITIVE